MGRKVASRASRSAARADLLSGCHPSAGLGEASAPRRRPASPVGPVRSGGDAIRARDALTHDRGWAITRLTPGLRSSRSQQGRFGQAAAVPFMMGPFSIVLRAPFAWAAGQLGAGELWTYRAGILPCLAATAIAGLHTRASFTVDGRSGSWLLTSPCSPCSRRPRSQPFRTAIRRSSSVASSAWQPCCWLSTHAGSGRGSPSGSPWRRSSGRYWR